MFLSSLARSGRKINSKSLKGISLHWTQCRHIAVAQAPIIVRKPDNKLPPNVTSQHHRINCCANRCYSTDRNDDLENWSRKLPSFGDVFVTTPTFYLMLKNALSAIFIRAMFDETFDRKEFLSGTKHAIQVVSNILAAGKFEQLEGLVKDSTISKMRQIVGPMTSEQRKEISVQRDDIQWAFPYEIQFITKENRETKKVRFFVEILVVFHMYKGEDLEFSDVMRPQENMIDELEKNYSVANYRFVKEFTKGVDDDWIINYILHVKPTDVMKEREKLVKDL